MKKHNIPVLDRMKKKFDPQELSQLHKVYCLQASALDFVYAYVLPILKMFEKHHYFSPSANQRTVM